LVVPLFYTMPLLTFSGRGPLGKHYRGYDPTTGAFLVLEAGQTFDCSQAKAAQLLGDFPADFEPGAVKAEAGPMPEPRKPRPAQRRGPRGLRKPFVAKDK
jgi:hypothetical protein